MNSSPGTSNTQTRVEHGFVATVRAHKYYTFTRSAKSEAQLLLAPKSYEFYATADEALRHFELEPPCEGGEFYEVGWGGLQLFHGMTDWRRIEATELRRGVR